MELTDEENARIDAALAKLPQTFVPLEGDAVPLGPRLLITGGTDLQTGSHAILFNDEGEILHRFTRHELLALKWVGRIPDTVPIPSSFDERGRKWFAEWVEELS